MLSRRTFIGLERSLINTSAAANSIATSSRTCSRNKEKDRSDIYVKVSGHSNLFNFRELIKGKLIGWKETVQGRAVFLVNTASLCGLTPQLKEMQLVHRRFMKDLLVVGGKYENTHYCVSWRRGLSHSFTTY